MKQNVLVTIFLFFVVAMLFGCAAQVTVSSPPPPPSTQEELAPEETAQEEPPVESEAPPEVVVVPSGESYVYMVPNMFGVYFYGGSWYRYYNGYWFTTGAYGQVWTPVAVAAVPGVIVSVPPEYAYSLPPQYHRIHYHEFQRDWRDWDRSRHWNRYDWYKHEMREDIIRERQRQIERTRERWRHGEGQRPAGFAEQPRRRPGDTPGKPERATPRKPEPRCASEKWNRLLQGR